MRLTSLAELRLFAAGFAALLRPGDAVALRGAVGAGKTTFVRAVAERLGCGDTVSSPSFTFWQRYDGATPVHHLDLYRIERASELRELGLEEAFDATAVVFVEWPERAPELLPTSHTTLEFVGADEEPRTVRVRRAA